MRHDEYREPLDTPTTATRDVQVRTRSRWLSPGRVLAFLVGLVLAVVGVVAIVRGGIDGTLNVPLVDVFGMTQSALVGIIELVAGLIIMGCSASEAGRGVIGLIGVLGIVAGVVAVAASPEIQQDVGFAGNRTGWFLVVTGALALLGAVLPSFLSHRREVREYEADPRLVRHV